MDQQHNGGEDRGLLHQPIHHQPVGPETAQGQDSGQAGCRHQIGPRGGGHAAAQSAKLGDVLTIGGGDNTAHTHEQQRLGQAVGQQHQQGHNGLLQGDSNKDQAKN